MRKVLELQRKSEHRFFD